jgi:uncharacterized protein (DUF1015 family)
MFKIVDIKNLKQHEEIDPVHLSKLKVIIKRANIFKEPIIVDNEYLIVLDGHHRLNICKQLGLSKIPCIFVDYLNDSKIRVTTRRKEYKITKGYVVDVALQSKVFPKKTTKHYIPYRVNNLKIPLASLI